RSIDAYLRAGGDAGLQHDPGHGDDAVSYLPTYLPAGLPIPVAENDGLDKPYWDEPRRGEVLVQRCKGCGTFQWGPEWICHKCLSFDMEWQKVSGRGRIYSWERPWHPVHPALKGHGS